jgi:alkanesulfonate monooxygenase SsuD/methylene tetrahydromethanopterin reductase-like flavin-dependent oxidoreductase (luciferase family)
MPEFPVSSVSRGSDPVRFAYSVPNVSGGLVTSTIEQRTDGGYDYNRELAVLAENHGFDHALSQVRYMASYGAEFQHESTSFSLALLLATQRLKVIARALRKVWTEEHAELAGDFYRLRDFSLKPKPLNTAERPPPEIFQGGNSTAARAMAGRVQQRQGLRRRHRADRRRLRLGGPSRSHGIEVRPQRFAHRPRHGGDSSFEDFLGVDLFLLGFLHYLEEVEYFGKRVLPLVRELEAQEAEPEPVAAHP